MYKQYLTKSEEVILDHKIIIERLKQMYPEKHHKPMITVDFHNDVTNPLFKPNTIGITYGIYNTQTDRVLNTSSEETFDNEFLCMKVTPSTFKFIIRLLKIPFIQERNNNLNTEIEIKNVSSNSSEPNTFRKFGSYATVVPKEEFYKYMATISILLNVISRRPSFIRNFMDSIRGTSFSLKSGKLLNVILY